MKSLIKIVAILFILISLTSAQNYNDLQNRLRQLDTKLRLIKTLALKYHNQQAHDLINLAYYDYNIALNRLMEYKADPSKKYKLVQAAYWLSQANKRADQAARLVLFKPAAKAKAELDKLIRKAEILVHQYNNDEARYLLNRARAFQLKAYQAYKSGRFIQSQEYHRIAIYFANKTIELAEGGLPGKSQKVKYEEQLKNIEILYNDVSSESSNNSDFSNLLQKAKSFIDKSKNHYEKGQFKQALIQLQISERLLYRAVDVSQNTMEGKEENVKSNLNSLKRYIAGIEKSLFEDNSGYSNPLLKKAKQFCKGAERDIEKGNYTIAQNKIVLAQRMATRALRTAGSQDKTIYENVLERINEVERLILLQKQKINISGNETVEYIHKEAEHLLSKARSDYESGNRLSAFRKLQLAFRLVNRADFLLGESKIVRDTKKEIAGQIIRQNSILNKMQQSKNKNERIETTVPLLLQMLSKAESNLQQGHLGIAAELVDLVQSQINALLKDAVN
jgi:hypothetical protein